MKKIKLITFILALLGTGILLAEPLAPAKIEVFSNWEIPAQEGIRSSATTEVLYYKVDSPLFKKEQDEETGEEFLALTIERDTQDKPLPLSEETINDINAAHAAKVLLTQYDLKWLPAIVFDGGRSVVYGVVDLNEALERYRAWKQQQGQSGRPN